MSYTSSSEKLKHTVIDKLRHDPLSITPQDARRLSEQFEVTDGRTANFVSAVEALAVANNDIKECGAPAIAQDIHVAQMTLVNDLNAAVDKYPRHVTIELLKSTQAIVSKMQRALGHINAPHPELEAELQAEFAKIEPKIEQGTVTKEEADHLHSLEARAHGHTERGGLTAVAQSVVARRERALSLSDTTNESLPTRGNSMTTKATSTTPATVNDASSLEHGISNEIPRKMSDLSLAENYPANHAKGDSAHGRARKGSSATAVDAH